jgi:dipeptidyl aminopeptidase/acylaminoacyl peptidase
MNIDVIKDVCWTSEDYTTQPIHGVVLSFHGLGGGWGKNSPWPDEYEFTQAGGLIVHPYYGPWSWMNAKARAMIDDLVDAVYAKWQFPASLPLIATGGSMGGQGALLYTRYARRKIAACYANCPAADLRFHFTERPDLPASIRYAAGYPDDLEAYFRSDSPLEQVANLPDIPYLLVQGGKDTAVNKQRHADVMVAAMRQRGLKVDYLEIPLMGHCSPLPAAALKRAADFVRAAMGG